MYHRLVRILRRLLSPRHNSDKLDAIAVFERASGPLFPHQSLAIEFDQQSLGIQPAVGSQLSQGHGNLDLTRAPIDKNTKTSGSWFSHGKLTESAFLGIEQIKIKNNFFLNLRLHMLKKISLHPGLMIRRQLGNPSAL